MYIQNRRNSCKFNGCNPLQFFNGLISLNPAIAYFAYTYRWQQAKETFVQIYNIVIFYL